MVFFRVVSRLPLSVLYGFSDFIYLLLRYIVRYRWVVVLENLQNAFPEKTAAERRRIANGFYRNLSDIFVETLKGLTISEAELRRRIVVKNQEVYQNYVAEGQVVLAMTSHLCNWEWSALAMRLTGPALDVVYKPLTSPLFDTLMRGIRGRFGTRPVPMQGLLRDIVRRRGEARVIGLVADQASEMPEVAYWTQFLAQETDFFTGTEKLARSNRYPVVFLSMCRVRRGYYEMTYHPLASPPYDGLPPNALIETYARRLESTIHQYPSDWLWSHKRWKHKKEDFVG